MSDQNEQKIGPKEIREQALALIEQIRQLADGANDWKQVDEKVGTQLFTDFKALHAHSYELLSTVGTHFTKRLGEMQALSMACPGATRAVSGEFADFMMGVEPFIKKAEELGKNMQLLEASFMNQTRERRYTGSGYHSRTVTVLVVKVKYDEEGLQKMLQTLDSRLVLASMAVAEIENGFESIKGKIERFAQTQKKATTAPQPGSSRPA